MLKAINSECVERVADAWDLRYVVLYGSQAKGYAKEFSDVDIDVKAGRELNFIERGRLYSDLEYCVNGKLDLSFLGDWNPVLAWEVLTKGNIIYAKDLDKVVKDKVKTIVEVCDLEPLLRFSYQENKRALSRLNSKDVKG